MSLSGASYPNLGRNLFQPATVDDVHSFAMNYQYLVTQDGAVLKANPKVIYPFLSDDDLQLRDAISYNQTALVNRGRAYDDLMDWMMRKQLAGQLTP